MDLRSAQRCDRQQAATAPRRVLRHQGRGLPQGVTGNARAILANCLPRLRLPRLHTDAALPHYAPRQPLPSPLLRDLLRRLGLDDPAAESAGPWSTLTGGSRRPAAFVLEGDAARRGTRGGGERFPYDPSERASAALSEKEAASASEAGPAARSKMIAVGLRTAHRGDERQRRLNNRYRVAPSVFVALAGPLALPSPRRTTSRRTGAISWMIRKSPA